MIGMVTRGSSVAMGTTLTKRSFETLGRTAEVVNHWRVPSINQPVNYHYSRPLERGACAWGVRASTDGRW